MIKTRVKPLPKPASNNLTDGIMVPIINKSAEGIAKELEKSFKKLKCEKHPNAASTITIIPDKKGGLKFEKNSFCCREFADAVKINVK